MAADPLAELTSAPAAIGRPTATARRLVNASLSNNTRRAYAGALGQLDARLAGQADPAGEQTARVLAGYRRTAGGRGRGQARPFTAEDLAAVLATSHLPRRRGRGVESDQVAATRGRLDAVIAGLLFIGGLRRSQVSALRWADVEDAGDGILVTVRRSKTNQAGETNDVRYLKSGPARAVRELRAATAPAPAGRVVPLSPQAVGLRFTAAAEAGGLERRVTAHSGRVGLASELTSRGASTTAVMLAGNWKTSRMVALPPPLATGPPAEIVNYADDCLEPLAARLHHPALRVREVALRLLGRLAMRPLVRPAARL